MFILQPKNMVEGGLVDDITATITEIKFVTWDYNGKIPVAVPAIKASLETDDREIYEQYWSIGKGSDWAPSENGASLIAIGRATSLVNSSNGAIFIQSMVNSGFPENKITEEITCFEGIKAHFSRAAAPKRNITKLPRADGRVFEDTILVVDNIISMPGERGKGKGKPSAIAAAVGVKAATAADVPPAKNKAEGSVDDTCISIVLELLTDNPNGLSKSQIPGLAFKKVIDLPNKNAIIARIFNDSFLSSGPWVYADGKVTSA